MRVVDPNGVKHDKFRNKNNLVRNHHGYEINDEHRVSAFKFDSGESISGYGGKKNSSDRANYRYFQ
ncbi:hypothetical protein D3C86_2166450 [compost metagenome]